jgi:arylsulfatase A-like enzyme/Tfp pilus assembly protein PilF
VPSAIRTTHWGWVLLILLLAVGVGAGLFAFRKRSAQSRRPQNVLLITMDTTRADYLGCFGAASAQTPNIDHLAHKGTMFTNCTTCAPLTLPSHASILTGVYPYVHGARENGTGRLAESNMTLSTRLKAAGRTTQATIASFVLNRKFGLDQGFDVYHEVAVARPGDELHAERRGDEVCNDALEMLHGLAKKPFFLWVHFYDPHFPYISQRIQDPLSPLAYADEITFMDTQIGRLLAALRDLQLDQSTLVVAVADHGEGLSDHDEWKHGYFLYETTLHTPLIFRCPGVAPAAKTVAAQVRTIDIAPTILEILGLPAWEQIQGISLVPLLSGQKADLGLAAYSETFQAQIEYGLSQLRSLTVGGWKYVLAPKPELYHVATDAAERTNLVDAEPQRAERMRAQLRQLLADAPPPPAPQDSTAALTDDDRARLASLGYVGAPGSRSENATELDRFEPRGGNPHDYARSFKQVSRDLPQMLKRKDYASAEQMLRELIRMLPDAAYLPAHLAEVLDAQGRTDEATQAFEQAVALAPDDYTVRMKYGAFLRRVQRPTEALAQFAVVLQNAPDDTRPLIQAALALLALQDFDGAEAHVRRALELEPRSATALRTLGLICESAGRVADAVRYFNEALASDPNCADCAQDRDRAAAKLGW